MRILTSKLKEVAVTVIPIVIIVTILNLTLVPLEKTEFIRFLLGSLLIILGLTIFLIGIDVGITPVGELFGSKLAKSNKVWIVAVVGIVLGFVISVAEPDLGIFALQVKETTQALISNYELIIYVSLGVAVMISVGLLRIVFDTPYYIIMIILYTLILLTMTFIPHSMIAIAFDASGATTGALTTPFILALAVGVSTPKKKANNSEQDSFGLVGLASAGAIVGVILLTMVKKVTSLTGTVEDTTQLTEGIIMPFIKGIPEEALHSIISLGPIFGIFIISQIFVFKLSQKQFGRYVKGFIYAYVGLVLFLVGAHQGFMDVGTIIGRSLALLDNKIWLFIVSFAIGLFIVLAEPAVFVLTQQIETITNGYVKKKFVALFLSIAMGIALILNLIRVFVPGVQFWHILVPGYIIALSLTFFTPKLFVGIAFDAGGVASGPMSATFILTFAQGIAFSSSATSIIENAFGMIALIAMMPIISIQVLGLVFKYKSKKEVPANEF